MPRRAATGKQIGGAEKERRKKAEREQERGRTGGQVSGLSLEPPPANTADLIPWGARALAATLYRASQDRSIFVTELDQLRFIADCCAKLGIIRDKTAEQKRIKEGLKKIRGEDEAKLDDVSGRRAPRIPRPTD